jgi:hypothetical protein
MVGCAAAEPVGEGCDYVGCDHEEGKVVLPQSGGEDDEKEADCQNLLLLLDLGLLEQRVRLFGDIRRRGL